MYTLSATRDICRDAVSVQSLLGFDSLYVSLDMPQ